MANTKKTENEKVEQQEAAVPTQDSAEPKAELKTEVKAEPVTLQQRQVTLGRVTVQPQRQAPAPAPQPQPPKKPVAAPQMGFLGVRCREGGNASLPVVVKAAGELIGVVVLQDPSYGGSNLGNALEQAGYPGPFTYHTPGEFSAAVKADVAKVIRENHRVAGLDHKNALRAFGYGEDNSIISR